MKKVKRVVKSRPLSAELGTREFWERAKENPQELAREICAIDTVDMDRTLRKHSGIRAWIAASFEVMRVREAQAELDVEKAEAAALLEARSTNDEQTGKPKIADVMKAEVQLNKKVLAAKAHLFDLQERSIAIKAINKVMEDRLQMLIQLSANQRKEQDA